MTEKNKKKLNWLVISWFVLFTVTIIFCCIAFSFVVFPDKYKLPLVGILLVIVACMGFFSLKKRGNHKSAGKTACMVINCVLCVCMVGGSIYLPVLQAKMKGLFVEPSNTQEIKINAYVMTSEYKSAHASSFTSTDTKTSLEDYKNANFLIEKQVDKDNEEYAVQDIEKQIQNSAIKTTEKQDVMSAVASLYKGEGDVLLLNENFENTITEVPGYENFKTDTQIIYTSVKTVQVATPTPAVTNNNITNSSFMMFIAGSDSRESTLTQYTRTDVDILLTVDPVNHQVLLISIPRDWYVRNPALGNGYDKLTHLGNDGMSNSMAGLNQEFSFDYINNYLEVNFVTFKNIIDAVGGIDINNPYAFSDEAGDSFPEGTIHLEGDAALNYVRERHMLSNGDYGRNEHQAIILQGILTKLTSKAVISDFGTLLNNLQGNFLTSLSSDDIYALAEKQLNDGASWSFISYHLGGVGDYNSTASMGSMQLYVSNPIAEQVIFAKEQMTKVINGEKITQETLPANDETVFLPN